MSRQTEKIFKFDYPLLVIFATALIIRLLYLTEIAHNNPFFYSETLVAEVHHLWAQDIISGENNLAEPFLRAPLYPYFLAAIYSILGENMLFPRLIQLVIGVILTFPLYTTGKRLFGRGVGLVAAVLWAIYSPEIFFEGELFETSLTVALTFAAYLSCAESERTGKLWWSALTGVIIGLATILKPNAALFFLLLAIWYLFGKNPVGNKVKQIALLAIGFTLAIAPVTIRNFKVSGELVPVATYGGLNFYIGNNPESDGVSAVLPDAEENQADLEWGRKHHADVLTALSIRKASQAIGRQLTAKQSSDYWWHLTLQFVAEQPGTFLLLNLRKLILFFDGFEYANTNDLYFNRRYSTILSVLLWSQGLNFPFGIILPFTIMGAYYLIKNRIPGRGLFTVFVMGAILSVTPLFVCSRFRVTAMPFFILLTGYGMVETLGMPNGKKKALHGALLLFLLILTNLNFFKLERDVSYQEYYKLGRKYSELGRFQEAYDSFQNSYRANDQFQPTLTELGLILERKNDLKGAANYFRQALTLTPNNPIAHYNLGLMEAKAGNLDSALTELTRAVNLDSNLWQAWIDLGITYFYLGDSLSAEKSFMRSSEIAPANLDAYYNLINYYLVTGDTLKAIEKYQRQAELFPDNPKMQELLGRLNAEKK